MEPSFSKPEKMKNLQDPDEETEKDLLNPSAAAAIEALNSEDKKQCKMKSSLQAFTIIYIIFSTILVIILIIIIFYILCSISMTSDRNRPQIVYNCTSLFFANDFRSNLVEKGKNITSELNVRINSNDWVLFRRLTKWSKSYTIIENEVTIYKINGTINTSPEKMVKVLFEEKDKYPQIFDDAENATIIKRIDDFTLISYEKSKALGPMSARDSLLLNHYEKLENGFVFGYESIEYGEEQLDPEIVRSFHGVSGWTLMSNAENGTNFQMLIDVNIKMIWIPLWDNILVTAINSNLKSLKKWVERDDNDN